MRFEYQNSSVLRRIKLVSIHIIFAASSNPLPLYCRWDSAMNGKWDSHLSSLSWQLREVVSAFHFEILLRILALLSISLMNSGPRSTNWTLPRLLYWPINIILKPTLMQGIFIIKACLFVLVHGICLLLGTWRSHRMNVALTSCRSLL